MRAMERRVLLKKLDREMRHYRLAARGGNPTNELLRMVRKVLRVPMKEMAEKMGIVESALFQMEDREGTGSITLRSLGRMAGAMGCKLVYGVVPLNGKTLEELAEERLWREVLGSGVSGVSGVGGVGGVSGVSGVGKTAELAALENPGGARGDKDKQAA